MYMNRSALIMPRVRPVTQHMQAGSELPGARGRSILAGWDLGGHVRGEMQGREHAVGAWAVSFILFYFILFRGAREDDAVCLMCKASVVTNYCAGSNV